ncbi:MAG: hypothetical protein ACE5JU_09560 [Candidatus Binatia bacterium]
MSKETASYPNLAKVRELFIRDKDNILVLRGSFVNYSTDLSLTIRMGRKVAGGGRKVAINLQHIIWDLWNIGALFERLENTTHLASLKRLNVEVWRKYIGLDIEHFHIELRSVLDYTAACISATADRKNCVPPNSINDIINWLKRNPGNRTRLGEELAVLVESVPSFPDIKQVRDAIVHRGGQTLVFGSPNDGILFQAYENFTQIIAPSVFVSDGSIIDFRRYGSLLFSELLFFLEQLAETLRKRIPADHFGIGDAHLSSLGWEVFYNWLNQWEAIPSQD